MSKYIELTNAYLYSFLLRIDINHKAWVDTFFLCRLFFPLSCNEFFVSNNNKSISMLNDNWVLYLEEEENHILGNGLVIADLMPCS